MKTKAIFVVMVFLLCSVAMFAQEGAQGGGQGRGQGRAQGRAEGRGGGQQQETVVATDKVTPDIPGVVKAGTKIEIVKNGLRGSDGGVGMPDGSLLVASTGRLKKRALDGHWRQLVEYDEPSPGVAGG